MPGSTARLFDVKRAIVKANKLDRSTGGGMQLEFDISVKNAMTDEEYTDENMILPRGTRIIVQRLPAARGQGLLARIARADAGMHSGVAMTYGNVAAAENGFYTIQSTREDDDEFVSIKSNANVANVPEESDAAQDSEEKELAALKAVTDQAGSVYRSNNSLVRSLQPSKFGATVSDGQPSQSAAAPFRAPTHSYQPRPNADPELREQERILAQQAQPTKRRATGIPRTFLNIPPSANSVEDEESEGIKLQPNVIGFQALVNRGGGQSGSSLVSKRRDLDYALKLTATEIPEHLQCGICAQVVKNAMLVPWDAEGRTACELCMRDGLAKSGFVCPLTGQEGVSPDDLIPNVGLRKAADLFVKDVMEKMEQIIQQQEADEEQEREKQATEAAAKKEVNEFEGDELDKGLVLRRGIGQSKSKRRSNDFGDDFGGDVFDVEAEEQEEEKVEDTVDEMVVSEPNTLADSSEVKEFSEKEVVHDKSEISSTANDSEMVDDISGDKTESTTEKLITNVESKNNDNSASIDVKMKYDDFKKTANEPPPSTNTNEASTPSRRELLKKRAPPAGYQMGPAPNNGQEHNPVVDRGYGGHGSYNANNIQGPRGQYYGGRGRGRFSRPQPNYNEHGRGQIVGPHGRSFIDQGGYDPMLKHSHDTGNRPGKRPHSEIEDFGSRGSGRSQGAARGGRWPGGIGRVEFGRTPPGGRLGYVARGSFRGAPPAGRGRAWDDRGPVGRYNGRGRH